MVLATFSEMHLLLALVIVFLLFGGKKLPELARGLGEAMKEFKKAQHDMTSVEQAPTQPQTVAQRTAASPSTSTASTIQSDLHKPA